MKGARDAVRRLLSPGTVSPANRWKVIFLHSPKSGGTTFTSLLRQAFPESCATCKTEETDGILSMFQLVECLILHVGYDNVVGLRFFHKGLLDEPNLVTLRQADTFTMLREPVDHFLSLAAHYARGVQRTDIREALQGAGFEAGASLRSFLTLPYDNPQLGFLLGEPPRIDRRPFDEGDLARAKHLITSLPIHVGITERYGESLHVFESVTGRRLPPVIQIQNRTAARLSEEDVSPELRRLIEDKTALDAQLYEFALGRLDEELGVAGPMSQSGFSFTLPSSS